MNSVFNTERFMTAIKLLDKSVFTNRDLEYASDCYIDMQETIRSVFGDQFEDTMASLSSLADVILAKTGLSRRFTVVVELVILQFFVEGIIDAIQGRSKNRKKDSEVLDGEGVLCHAVGWEQGSVRSGGSKRKARSSYPM